MQKKIAVLGCGAIGGSVSADLTRAGCDVTVIDQPARCPCWLAACNTQNHGYFTCRQTHQGCHL